LAPQSVDEMESHGVECGTIWPDFTLTPASAFSPPSTGKHGLRCLELALGDDSRSYTRSTNTMSSTGSECGATVSGSSLWSPRSSSSSDSGRTICGSSEGGTRVATGSGSSIGTAGNGNGPEADVPNVSVRPVLTLSKDALKSLRTSSPPKFNERRCAQTLPATLCSLALCKSRELDGGGLHRLELRLAPCWQDLVGCVGEPGSLQVSPMTCSQGSSLNASASTLSSLPSPWRSSRVFECSPAPRTLDLTGRLLRLLDRGRRCAPGYGRERRLQSLQFVSKGAESSLQEPLRLHPDVPSADCRVPH